MDQINVSIIYAKVSNNLPMEEAYLKSSKEGRKYAKGMLNKPVTPIKAVKRSIPPLKACIIFIIEKN